MSTFATNASTPCPKKKTPNSWL